MQEEVWKDVPSFEGMYQVSNLGRVKSLAREVLRGGKYPFISKEKILIPGLSSNYLLVVLRKNNKSYSKKVHQLVAITFLNHTPNGYKIVVDHINNNPLDNRVENLQLITHRENSSKDRLNYTSKYIGVFWDRERNKWKSSIKINGKHKHLGRFKTEIEASKAYQSKLKEILNNK